MAEAELARFIDRYTMEYVRTYAHPIERVWRAITEPKEFRQWFIPGSIELRTGGAYEFKAGDFSGTVQEIDPPHKIRFSGGLPGSYFQYELTEVEDGTQMRFVNHFGPAERYPTDPNDLGGDLPAGLDTPWAPGFVGGWHEYWDALGDFLTGIPIGSRLPATEFQALAESWAKDGLNAGILDPKGAARLVLQFRRKERWNELNKVYREFIRANCPPK
jgi:uncharacterized protein YndB with AHSA1/START domain